MKQNILSGNNGKYYKAALHLMVWLLLFAFPYLLSYGQEMETRKLLEHFWLPLVYSAVIFYVNLYLFIDRFLFGGKVPMYVFLNVLLILLFWLLHHEIRQWYFMQEHVRVILEDGSGKMRPLPPFQLFVYRDVISLVIPVVFSIAVRAMERWLLTETKHKEAEHERLLAELRDLKYRLQPHFFFNSLNNIYSLVDVSPDKAKETLHALGKLMRYLLYETDTERVRLSHEVEFLLKYIDLMRLRLSNGVQLHVDFSPEIPASVQVAPLLFISLIENAFKHGVSATQPSEISFRMWVQEGRVHFVAQNTDFAKKGADASGSGIGLDNLRKRLALVYPGQHGYSVSLRNSVYRTELWVDANDALVLPL